MKVARSEQDLTWLHKISVGSFSDTKRTSPLFRRSARSRVNNGGMCCTMRMGRGKLAGKVGRIEPRAEGPPVEMPITTTLGCFAGVAPYLTVDPIWAGGAQFIFRFLGVAGKTKKTDGSSGIISSFSRESDSSRDMPR